MIYFHGTSHAAKHLRHGAWQRGVPIAEAPNLADLIFVSEDTKTDDKGVRDEEPIRQGLIDLFVYHRFSVKWVSDGKAAVQLATTESFDLIVLDVMLPLKDGFTVCHEIRQVRPRIPIVMLTARTSEDDIINQTYPQSNAATPHSIFPSRPRPKIH